MQTFGKRSSAIQRDAVLIVSAVHSAQTSPGVLAARTVRARLLRSHNVAALTVRSLPEHHAVVATLTASQRDIHALPPTTPDVVLMSAAPNGPNALPASAPAVGLVAA